MLWEPSQKWHGFFYMATRDAGADVTEAALLTRQYLIATMYGKDRDTTEDDDG